MPPNPPTSISASRPPDALGQSEPFLAFQRLLSRVAKVNRPVLLIGERGTGKELAASRLHFLSPRWEAPLVALNCAALAPTLIESELFGHEEGAFTGANKKRLGRFELAHGGTLFLDEIGNIPLETQEKILRVVEYGSFERVGGNRSVQVDVRLIGATNADLIRLAEEGRFKHDLLDRLSFEVLILPPLRERRGDILLLANFFASRMAHELGWEEVPSFSEEAEKVLEDYPWPGNIRELKNVVERAVYRSDSPVISEIRINPFGPSLPMPPPEIPPPPSVPGPALPPKRAFAQSVQEFERQLLNEALSRTGGNQRQAAENLGLSYDQFRWLYRKYRPRSVE
jgi:psp operon transcriptional activator